MVFASVRTIGKADLRYSSSSFPDFDLMAVSSPYLILNKLTNLKGLISMGFVHPLFELRLVLPLRNQSDPHLAYPFP